MYSPTPPLLSIAIPTLRGYDHLIRLLRSIEAYTPVDYEIVIVDSGSRTRGYVVPMNQALDAARGQYVVALNDDVEVTPGWIEPLLDEAQFGTPVCFPDQSALEGFQCIVGCCMMFRADFLRDWGGFDEQYVIWCFAEGTLVSTPAGLRPIEEVRENDPIHTATGAISHVSATGSRVAQATIELVAQGLDATITTPEHPYLACRRIRSGEHGDPEWIEAGSLRRGDLVAFPTCVESNIEPPLISAEQAYVVGRWLADGWTAHGRRPPCRICGQAVETGLRIYCADCRASGRVRDRRRTLSRKRSAARTPAIGLSDAQREARQENARRLNERRWGVDDLVPVVGHQREAVRSPVATDFWLCGAQSERDEIAAALTRAGLVHSSHVGPTDVRFRLGVEARAWLKDCGAGARGKRVPGWVLALPEVSRHALLEGYVDGDGNRCAGTSGRAYIRTSSVNRALTHGMAQLARSLGYVPRLYASARHSQSILPNGRKLRSNSTIYEMHYACEPGALRRGSFKIEDGAIWAPVREIRRLGSRRVFNLSVAGEETFIADGVAVHNCSDIDLCKYLHEIGLPPKRVAIPNLLVHHGSQTTARLPEIRADLDPEAVEDLARYQAKWGTSALEDKHALAT